MKCFSTVLASCVCIALIGCTGDSSGPSPFAGSYQGTFSSSNTSDQGSVTMTVDDNGNVTGRLVDDATNPATTEDMSGTIQDNGDISGDFTDSAGNSPFGGNLGFDNTGRLSGPINITTSNGVINAQFSLSMVNGLKRYGTRIAVQPKSPSSGKAWLK